MRLAIALLLAAASLAAGQSVPKSACDFDGFDINAKLAEVKTATTAYFGCGTGKCLPMPLRPQDPVVISRAEGDWTCGYLVQRDGAAQGWIQFGDIRLLQFNPNPGLAAWAGTWVQDENRIRIRPSKSRGKLAVAGTAVWHGRAGSVNSGQFVAELAPAGNKLHVDDSGCKIDLALVGDYLLANDNNMCGGMNVRFWGVWRRAKAVTNR